MRCSTVGAWHRALIAVPIALAAACYVALTGCASRERKALGPELFWAQDRIAACPRDAARDSAGRCTCENGTVQAMGACVEPGLAEVFCAPGARMTADGCTFRSCDAGEQVDVATGECVSRTSLPGADSTCPDGTVAAIASSRLYCVPGDAGCPRGTRRAAARATHPPCQRPARCPPGSLGDGAACAPIAFSRERAGADPSFGTGVAIDLGAWVSRALGIDGGPGSSELCRPLEMRPDLFPVERGAALVPLDIQVAISVPDQDVTQVHASVAVRAPEPLSLQAENAVRGAVGTLVELFRSLGGDATSASANVRVKCTVGSEGPSAR